MTDWINFAFGCFLMLTSLMANLWHDVAPFLTGFTGLLAAILALHSIARLIYRVWSKGFFSSVRSKDNI